MISLLVCLSNIGARSCKTLHVIQIKPEHVFEALADPNCLRIVRLLATTGEEADLCELVDSLQEPEYKLSRHIKVLKQTGILSAEKSGRWVDHRLLAEVPDLSPLVEAVKALDDLDSVFAQDLTLFKKRMALREEGRCRSGKMVTD